MGRTFAHTAVLCLALGLAACGDDSAVGDGPIGGDADPNDGAGGADAACVLDNAACTGGGECCSGTCLDLVCVPASGCAITGSPCAATSECCAGNLCRDPGTGTTVCVLGLCTDETGPCAIDSDCCSLNCDGGSCGPASGACAITGGGCSEDGDCCSFNCGGTTCSASTASCNPIGEACTSANGCCSDFCANDAGAACTSPDVGCRCGQVNSCRAQGEICADDLDCCNQYCDRPDGVTVGHCASVGACIVVGEPCGSPGISGSCCSNACIDTGSGVATCAYLGGCLPINHICTADGQCCSGSCAPSGTTVDGRDILRCADTGSCLPAGEVCSSSSSSNCCPNGGGDFGCVPANSGISRCFGGEEGCTLPGQICTTVEECCTDPYPNIECSPGPSGATICCVPDGSSCAFGDVCCSGVCAPDSSGNLVCNPGGCVADGGACTADADCCMGCCKADATGALLCTTDCAGCTLGQLGEPCSDTAPCCPGLTCSGPSEFKSCSL